ncbi:Flp family type IVb pilin [Sphingomonas radiodurans]|uniref:Flp family type IVb pilin n=1 Tax=Sphingomonas radiodurans TaxID=2890321 RepID=UPI001E28D813|nr:Flp family type IVb pilin [Sphingomonas radiodurans]WBH17612.1 Flp family type IVb pilin [Sphingomonas radiodurans]
MRRRPSRSNLSLALLLRRLARDQRGATAIEYGLIIAVIVIAMMVSFMAVADTTKTMWQNVSTKVTQAR